MSQGKPLQPTRQELEAQRKAAAMEAKAREILTAARANIHTGMNRQRRRRAAKAAGIFKYTGLWAHILGEGERKKLEAKTIRNKVPINA